MTMRLALALLILLAAAAGTRAEAITIATTRSSSNAPFLIAEERGYFTAEGLSVELVFIDSAGPITSAVVSGSVDFGATGLSGAFYNLAGQGALRIIAGHIYEAQGFRSTTVVASNRAWEAGLKEFRDLGGHSVAVTQIGTPLHYSLGVLAEKYGFDFKSLRVVPTQSFPNAVAAVAGGGTDAAVVSASYVLPALDQGEVQLVGYIGDVAPMQIGAVFTATRTANERGDMIERFLRAFRRATHDYHQAFTGPAEMPAFNRGAPDIVDLMARADQQSPQQIRAALAYVDDQARIDVADIKRQIAWYRAQGMIKLDIDAETVIDRRYVIPLPR
jgi:NitT/TauT family transport system substrate-binding protein